MSVYKSGQSISEQIFGWLRRLGFEVLAFRYLYSGAMLLIVLAYNFPQELANMQRFFGAGLSIMLIPFAGMALYLLHHNSFAQLIYFPIGDKELRDFLHRELSIPEDCTRSAMRIIRAYFVKDDIEINIARQTSEICLLQLTGTLLVFSWLIGSSSYVVLLFGLVAILSGISADSHLCKQVIALLRASEYKDDLKKENEPGSLSFAKLKDRIQESFPNDKIKEGKSIPKAIANVFSKRK